MTPQTNQGGDTRAAVPESSPDFGLKFDAGSAPGVRTETILFVEDEAFVRQVTAEVLRSAGYVVLTAKSTADALRQYDQHVASIGLLLTDVILPGENGRLLARQLSSRNMDLKVLLVTGYGDQMDSAETNCPTTKCLSKPFSAGTLLRAVREVLNSTNFDSCAVVPVTRAGDIG
jgi:DNA-binding NtrC family response regulator